MNELLQLHPLHWVLFFGGLLFLKAARITRAEAEALHRQVRSPTLRSKHMDATSDKVLAEATRLAGGDPAKAREWYFNEPLHEFDGQTAAAAVMQGRGADVLLLLEFYEAGPLG